MLYTYDTLGQLIRVDDENELHFYYSAQGKPSVAVYNGTPYSYVKNLQGDIVAILNSAGTVVVSYVYDAWGRPIATTGSMADTLGVLNPFRYRGYVFDEETGLYYLRSRYFNWTLCRFINEDSIIVSAYIDSFANQFTYCDNNAINNSDPDGLLYLSAYHNKVQEDVLEQLRARGDIAGKEIGFFKWGESGRIGRADIISFTTGEVWEVKPHMTSFHRDPVGFTAEANEQLLCYVLGKVRRSKWQKELQVPVLKRGRSLHGSIRNGDETIIYWCNNDDGIIWYDIVDNNNHRNGERRHGASSDVTQAQVSALAAAVVVFTPIAVISLGTGDHDQQIRFAR